MSQSRRFSWYGLISLLFLVEVAAIALHADRVLAAPVVFWLLAGPAALRLARTVSFNGIGLPLRMRWTVTEPDGSGAGDTVNPRDGHPLGELIACPICTGTHAAALLLGLYAWLPAAGLAAVALLGVAGVSELLHWSACLVEWRGHVAREECGVLVRRRSFSASWSIPADGVLLVGHKDGGA